MELDEYQRLTSETNEHAHRVAIAVFGLAGEIGSIQSLYKKRLRHRGDYPAFKDELREELGDALWYLTSIATVEGLNLQEIADYNLRKTQAIFAEGDIRYRDEMFPKDEQLPRQFKVHLAKRNLEKK